MIVACDLHKTIRQAHSAENHDVHQERDNNHALIEAHQLVIFLQSVGDKVLLDSADEIKVQVTVDDEVEHFLYAVVDLINMNPTRRR
jgi:hypothetical protein